MEKVIYSLQHRLNPLHFYCRLMDFGLNRHKSITLAMHYERSIYRRLLPLMRLFYSN